MVSDFIPAILNFISYRVYCRKYLFWSPTSHRSISYPLALVHWNRVLLDGLMTAMYIDGLASSTLTVAS